MIICLSKLNRKQKNKDYLTIDNEIFVHQWDKQNRKSKNSISNGISKIMIAVRHTSLMFLTRHPLTQLLQMLKLMCKPKLFFQMGSGMRSWQKVGGKNMIDVIYNSKMRKEELLILKMKAKTSSTPSMKSTINKNTKTTRIFLTMMRAKTSFPPL